MTNVKNLLPIGSVVLNKGADKKLMIIGILIETNGVRYDYIGVLYPEGFVDAEKLFAFNHDDIEKVEYIGYMNAEYQLFRGAVEEQMAKD